MTKPEQVAEDVRHRIEAEEFKVGDKLPGVSGLARQYGCSWEVARQALWMLCIVRDTSVNLIKGW